MSESGTDPAGAAATVRSLRARWRRLSRRTKLAVLAAVLVTLLCVVAALNYMATS